MSILVIIALVLAGWCVASVIVAALFSLGMRGISDDPPAPPQQGGLRLVADDAA